MLEHLKVFKIARRSGGYPQGVVGGGACGHRGWVLDEAVQGQEGVVTRQQLIAAGVTPDRIRARVESGRWQRLHRGTYALFSGVPQRAAQLWAAVLYAGPDALLSHHSAAEVDGLVDQPSGRIHLTVPLDRRVRPGHGMTIHVSSRAREAAHPTRQPPRTRVEETVLDLAGCSTDAATALAWATIACGRRLTTPARLRSALAQRTRFRWRLEMGAALVDIAHGAQSPLELRYLRAVERAHRLPAGLRQSRRARAGGWYYDDVRYDRYGVHIELDGRAAHPEGARTRDQRRDNSAVAAGGVVLRYGWAEVAGDACGVAGQVATVLRLRGWGGAPLPCGKHCRILKTSGCWRPPKSSGS